MTDPSSIVRYLTPFATLDAARQRATEAVLGQSGLAHPTLAAEIRRQFGTPGLESALIGEPVLEAAPPYLASEVTLRELSGLLLHPKLVDALTDGCADPNYRFPRSLNPYRHQLQSWTQLLAPDPRSVLVTSGTGSGKTECFLVPLLSDLARQAEKGPLAGVQAIVLYPLNALIASQEERLRAWTKPFGGRIRFGLYNGLMPEDARERIAPPEQVIDRRTLRNNPPPILVTNVTMLEYMTVRRQDQPLIQKSRGQLRWVLIDEAHSYVGSSAAEIALLIRRVLLAFGVTPDQVRFVATSATIGEGLDISDKLRQFLADVSGSPLSRVDVVIGQRKPIDLPTASGPTKLTDDDLLERDSLGRNPVVHALAERLTRPVAWKEFSELGRPAGTLPADLARALTRRNGDVEPLIPLRVHGFLRAVSGLWTCLDPICSGKPDGEWPWGAIISERADICPHCNGTLIELVCCSACGEPFGVALEREGCLRAPPRMGQSDEFAAGSEGDEDGEREEDGEPQDAGPLDIRRLFAIRDPSGGRPLHVEYVGGRVCDTPSQRTITLRAHDLSLPEGCPACSARARSNSSSGALLRPFRFGAPFLIGSAAPVLLDGVEPPARRADPNASSPPPNNARQLLSFTDSRQSTARFAASLQTTSERNQVRALIYHSVQHSMLPPLGAEENAAGLKAMIARLEGIPGVEDLLNEQRKKLDDLSGSLDGIPWPTLKKQLAERFEVDDWLRRDIWASRGDDRFAEVGSEAFSEFLLLRELARRPRSANSLETLGLARLRFDAVDRLPESRLPAVLRDRALSLTDWHDFLHLLMTVSVRNAFAIRMNARDVHWLIRRGFPRDLLPPRTQKDFKRQLTWPVARPIGRASIPVRMLEFALKLDAGDKRDRDVLNGVLEEAWDCLKPLLTQPGAGDQYRLNLGQAHVAPVRRAYLCPVTRRLLDRTFVLLSPYGLDGSSRLAGQTRVSFDMPVHPNPHLSADRGGIAPVQRWLDKDEAIHALRAHGLWTDLHDRIALGAPYSRAAEHSAQQPPERLRRYEGLFKKGRINILNCSTTMEMGVDIGSVQTVMMTNVPPSIANYRQRVGRAGRRGQGFATSLTYTRDTPLDREAFRDPVTYLRRQVEPPRVSLDSQRIVQRHVNALLLAAWFYQAKGEVLRAKAGDFFGCPGPLSVPRPAIWPAKEFRDWLGLPSTAASMSDPLTTLLRGTCLEHHPGTKDEAADAVETAERGFVAEWDALRAQAEGVGRDVARKSIEFQMKRITDEFLLKELANRGVLPGHGFPTGVVPFVHRSGPEDDLSVEGEGARASRRSFPSRNLDLAIRDYAPGAEVVLDGLVYRSAGITLNWRRPAGDSDVREIQSLKWFWECPVCHAADVTRHQPERCSACAAALGTSDKRRFLEPAGFTVDDREKPHAEIEQVTFVEPEPERVSARGAAWRAFLQPTLGRSRTSNDGLVFYSSRGPDRAGYSVCLECGRAQSQSPQAEEIPIGQEHRPLRFTKADGDGCCPGLRKPFSLQTDLALGHDIRTDVAEVQPAALVSQDGAWAFASALRSALTRRLGIEIGEIGLSIVARRNPAAGSTHSVFLFDRAAGGAGYSTRLPDLFDDVLVDARNILACERKGCVGGCSSCVVTADLFQRAETIDRRAALACVEEILASQATPSAEDQVAGGVRLVRSAADTLLNTPPGPISIWPAAPLDMVDLSRDPLLTLFKNLASSGRKVTVVVEPDDLRTLDPAARLQLRDAAIRHQLVISTGAAPRFGDARAIASFGGGKVLASRDPDAALLGVRWGMGRTAPVLLFSGNVEPPRPVDHSELLPASGAAYGIINAELNGSSRTFGQRFTAWLHPLLQGQGLWRPGDLTGITYTDRYVRSPLVAHLLHSALSGIAGALAPRGRVVSLDVRTDALGARRERGPTALQHDWQIDQDRVAALTRLFATGWTADILIGPQPHSRRLELQLGSNTAIILLDQGFGFLSPRRRTAFDFMADPGTQAQSLRKLDVECVATSPSFGVVVPG